MDGWLILLIVATAAFVGSHLVLASPAIRGRLIARLGANGYRGAYALLALVLLVLIGLGHREAMPQMLWYWPWAVWVANILVPLGFILLIGGESTRMPALPDDPPRDGGPVRLPLFKAIARHPVLCAIALWALAHLLANGDVGSVVLFGGLLALALVGMHTIDAKRRADPEANFHVVEAVTSRVPFAAMLAGRNRPIFSWWDLARIGGAVLAWLVVLHVHQWLFGVYPWPL